MHITSVSMSDETWTLVKEKGLKFSECLEKGAKELAHAPESSADPYQSIEKETDTNKVKQMESALYTMQKHIDGLNKQLDEKNAILERKS